VAVIQVFAVPMSVSHYFDLV